MTRTAGYHMPYLFIRELQGCDCLLINLEQYNGYIEGSVGVLIGAGIQQTADQSDDDLCSSYTEILYLYVPPEDSLELFLVICPAMINYMSGVSLHPGSNKAFLKSLLTSLWKVFSE